MTGFTEDQLAKLSRRLHPKMVTRHKHKKQDYIESWLVEAQMNNIFGNDGWSSEVLELRLIDHRQGENRDGKTLWYVSYTCTCRVTVFCGNNQCRFHTGVGAGSGFAVQLSDAVDSAAKEAASDALKRAAKRFGWPLGLALYDKKKRYVGVDDPVPAPAEDSPVEPEIVDEDIPTTAGLTADLAKEVQAKTKPPEGPRPIADDDIVFSLRKVVEDAKSLEHAKTIVGAAVEELGGKQALTGRQRSVLSTMFKALPILFAGRSPLVQWRDSPENQERWYAVRDYVDDLAAWCDTNALQMGEVSK